MDNADSQEILRQRHQSALDIAELHNLRQQGLNGERRKPIVERLQSAGVNPAWWAGDQSPDAQHDIELLAENYPQLWDLTRQAIVDPERLEEDPTRQAAARTLHHAQAQAGEVLRVFLEGVDFTYDTRTVRPDVHASNWFEIDYLNNRRREIAQAARDASQQVARAQGRHEQDELKRELGDALISRL